MKESAKHKKTIKNAAHAIQYLLCIITSGTREVMTTHHRQAIHKHQATNRCRNAVKCCHLHAAVSQR